MIFTILRAVRINNISLFQTADFIVSQKLIFVFRIITIVRSNYLLFYSNDADSIIIELSKISIIWTISILIGFYEDLVTGEL